MTRFNIKERKLKVRASSAGLHIYNRDTGTNILVDEIILPPNSWSTAPRQVSIALTNVCDLACSHCYAPKSPATLALNKLTNWLIELDANGCVSVGFGGGEPTLYKRLVELCYYAVTRTNLAVTMTTHAHILSDRLLGELAGNLHFIRVSMDGVGSTYESIRHCPFDALITRIKAIRRVFKFGINFVVNSFTIGDLNAAVELAEDLGASEFLLLPEVPIGQGAGIDNETVNTLKKWVYGYNGSVPITVSEYGSDGLPTCNPFINENGLDAYAHIDAFGILKRTSYDLTGVTIRENGIMPALEKLGKIK